MADARPTAQRGLSALPDIFGGYFWDFFAYDCFPPLALLNRSFCATVRAIATGALTQELTTYMKMPSTWCTANLMGLVHASGSSSLQQAFVKKTWTDLITGCADAAAVLRICHNTTLIDLNNLSAARMQSLHNVAKHNGAPFLYVMSNAMGLLVQDKGKTSLLSIVARVCANNAQNADVVKVLAHHKEANYAVLLRAMRVVVDTRQNTYFMMPILDRINAMYRMTWMHDGAAFYMNAIEAGKTFVFSAIARESKPDMLHYLISWLKFRAKLTPAHASRMYRAVLMRECNTQEKAEKIVRAMHRLIANCAGTQQVESLHDVLGDFNVILVALYRKQLDHAFVHRIAVDWGPSVPCVNVATLLVATQHYYMFVCPTSIYQRKTSCFHHIAELKHLNPKLGVVLTAYTLKQCIMFANYCAEQECTTVTASSLYDALLDQMHGQ